MNRESIARYLQHTVLFQDGSAAELASHAELARVQNIRQGHYVYRKGDNSETFYVIARGKAELILTRDDGTNSVVGRIGTGGHFGETGILSSKPRSLSVRALCDLVVICFDRRYFKTAFLSNHRIHSRLDAALAERLRVAFLDQAHTANEQRPDNKRSKANEVILLKEKSFPAYRLPRVVKSQNDALRQSKTAQQTQAAIESFAANSAPYILTAESGTGKSIIAHQIHLQSERRDSPYREIDMREHDSIPLERDLFGTEQSTYPFAQTQQTSILEQASGGTVVFTHVHLMNEMLQQRLLTALKSRTFTPMDSDQPLAVQSRIVFISTHPLEHLKKTKKLLPELLEIFEKQNFTVPPCANTKKIFHGLLPIISLVTARNMGKKFTTCHQRPWAS